MVKKTTKKDIEEKKINPASFYQHVEEEYKPKASKEKIEQKPVNNNQMIKKEEVVEKKEEPRNVIPIKNSNLSENKHSLKLLLIMLIGAVVVFEIFFVWAVSNGEFKTECSSPKVTCSEINLSQINPVCTCNQTVICPGLNTTSIVDAINHLNFSVGNHS